MAAAWQVERKARQREGVAPRLRSMRFLVNELKKVPCKDCERSYPPYVMDFDHVRGLKRFGIAVALRGAGYSWDDVVEEIAKCDVVCANCHRIRTWGRR